MLRYRSVLPSGDSITMQRAGTEDTVWLEALFHAHYSRVVSVLVRITGDRSRAEEIASDVFCKAATRGADAEAMVPWIYRVAANAGLDAVRAQARRRTASWPDGGAVFRSEDDALDALIREERRVRVRLVLAKLKPRDAELLLLRAEGLAYREIAEVTGVSAGSVGTLLARAEAEFEKRFRGAYGEPYPGTRKTARVGAAVALVVAAGLAWWFAVSRFGVSRNRPLDQATALAAPPTPLENRPPERSAPVQAPAHRRRKHVIPRDVEAFVALDDEPIEAAYVVRVLLGAEETPADVLMTPDGRIHGVRMVRTGSERKGDGL